MVSNRLRLYIFIAAAITIVAAAFYLLLQLQPSPPRAAERFARHRVYMPILHQQGCNSGQPKRGVAPVESGVAYQGPLCLPPGFLCSTWAAVPDQAQCRGGRTLPMAYASTHNLRKHYPRDYDGLILFANEPDLNDQANLTVQETAALACEIQAYAPNAALAGPAYSAIGWHLMDDFWEAYNKCSGGRDAIVMHLAHVYAVRDSPYPNVQLDDFYRKLPPGQRGKLVYVHETGFHETANLDVRRWIREFDTNENVWGYAWFAPFPDKRGVFGHWQNLMHRDGRLTPLGTIYSGK